MTNTLPQFSILNSQFSILSALQLADSFFPSGMYTQSHGLERFVERGAHGATQIGPLLQSYLLSVAGPGDALAARWVARAAANGDEELVAAVDARLDATKLAAEGRLASRRCGKRMLLLGADLFAHALLRSHARRVASGAGTGHQAVALALLGVAAGLNEETVVLVELYTFATSLVSAAVRLGALDHAEGQRLLFAAQPLMAQAAQQNAALHWRDMGGFAPWIELMQFQHQHAEMHMFVS